MYVCMNYSVCIYVSDSLDCIKTINAFIKGTKEK